MAHLRAPAFRRLIASQINAASDALRRSHALRLKREYDLSQVEWRTISLVEFMQPVRLRDVAAESCADKAQISRIVTSLVKRGLIVRQEFIGDARSAMLELTSEGTKLAAQLTRLGEERETTLRAALGEIATEQLLRAIASVHDKATQMANEEEHLVSSPAPLHSMLDDTHESADQPATAC